MRKKIASLIMMAMLFTSFGSVKATSTGDIYDSSTFICSSNSIARSDGAFVKHCSFLGQDCQSGECIGEMTEYESLECSSDNQSIKINNGPGTFPTSNYEDCLVQGKVCSEGECISQESKYEGNIIESAEGNKLYLIENMKKRLVYSSDESVYWSAVMESHGLSREEVMLVTYDEENSIQFGGKMTLKPGTKYTLKFEDRASLYEVVDESEIQRFEDESAFLAAGYDLEDIVILPVTLAPNYTIVVTYDSNLPDLVINDIQYYVYTEDVDGETMRRLIINMDYENKGEADVLEKFYMSYDCGEGNDLTGGKLSSFMPVAQGKSTEQVVSEFRDLDYVINAECVFYIDRFFSAGYEANDNIIEEENEDNNTFIKTIIIGEVTDLMITNILATSIMLNSVIIQWDANEVSDNIFYYRKKGDSDWTKGGGTLRTSTHSQKIDNLLSSTKYEFYIDVKSVSDVTFKSDVFEFTTKESSTVEGKLTVSDIKVISTEIGATITWTSSAAGDSQIRYAEDLVHLADTKWGVTEFYNSGRVSHTANLTGLSSNTYYEFAVRTTNNSVGEPFSGSGHFITQSEAGIPSDDVINMTDIANLLLEEKLDEVLSKLNELQDTVREQNVKIKYLAKLSGDLEKLSKRMENAINSFITYGVDANTKKLGEGERAAVIHSYKAAFNKLPGTEEELADVIKIANGRWPSTTNEEAEKRAKEHFQKIYKRIADMNDPQDNAAVTVMAYGLRQKAENRNLDSERTGIKTFKAIYDYNPNSTEDWNTMQAITYSGATRGVDTDGDLLTDEREAELGTDPNNPDTDGDGFFDGAEVANNYDPLKK